MIIESGAARKKLSLAADATSTTNKMLAVQEQKISAKLTR